MQINLPFKTLGEQRRIGGEAGCLDIVRFLCLRLRQTHPPHLHFMFYIRCISRSVFYLDYYLFNSLIDRDCTLSSRQRRALSLET